MVIVFRVFHWLTAVFVIVIGLIIPIVFPLPTQMQEARKLRIVVNDLAIIAVGTNFTDIKIDYTIFGNIITHEICKLYS